MGKVVEVGKYAALILVAGWAVYCIVAYDAPAISLSLVPNDEPMRNMKDLTVPLGESLTHLLALFACLCGWRWLKTQTGTVSR